MPESSEYWLISAARYEADFNSPKHFPGLADNLSKWPPTYIVAAEKDCFRDDGRLLDELLRQSGVPSKLEYYEGLPHYFHGKWFLVNRGFVCIDVNAVFPALAVAHEMMANSVEGVRFILSHQGSR